MLEKSISQGGQFKEYFPMNWDDHLTGFIENEWMEKKIEGEAHMNSFSDVSGYVSYGNIILQYLIIEIMQIFQLVHLDHRKLEAACQQHLSEVPTSNKWKTINLLSALKKLIQLSPLWKNIITQIKEMSCHLRRNLNYCFPR